MTNNKADRRRVSAETHGARLAAFHAKRREAIRLAWCERIGNEPPGTVAVGDEPEPVGGTIE